MKAFHWAGSAFSWVEDHLGPYVMVIALAAVVTSTFIDVQNRIAVNHDKKISECQARYNHAFSVNIILRGKLSDDERAASSSLQNATAELIRAVFTLPKSATPAERTVILLRDFGHFSNVYQTYQSAERRIKQERRDNPFPVLPSVLSCG